MSTLITQHCEWVATIRRYSTVVILHQLRTERLPSRGTGEHDVCVSQRSGWQHKKKLLWRRYDSTTDRHREDGFTVTAVRPSPPGVAEHRAQPPRECDTAVSPPTAASAAPGPAPLQILHINSAFLEVRGHTGVREHQAHYRRSPQGPHAEPSRIPHSPPHRRRSSPEPLRFRPQLTVGRFNTSIEYLV